MISQSHGLTVYSKQVEGTLANYENLDNHQTGIHDYFKFLKYGFGRATDHACMNIRRGRITRAEGADLVRKLDGRFPWVYLGKHLEDIIAPLGLTVDEFIKLCDRYTNIEIFEDTLGGSPVKQWDGSLVKREYA